MALCASQRRIVGGVLLGAALAVAVGSALQPAVRAGREDPARTLSADG